MTARERAGRAIEATQASCPHLTDESCGPCAFDIHTKAIEAALADEREACARLAETGSFEIKTIGYLNGDQWPLWLRALAKAIRSRGAERPPRAGGA